jgi:S-DNA-T family DNA segregation ATPase FtsK/SpoIIIE
MEAPIPGKSLVGIEVPNEKRMVVHLREMLESEEFSSFDSKLRLAVGRDVSGMPVIDDLETMPHLLIAGATGSGKSVGMNTFLLSLLYQNSPQDLKFIMVDPKRVELTLYNGIPHLLTPVITESEKAHSSLKWAVAEMQRRYQDFAEKGYKNIKEYNAAEEKPLHRIVIVIDELADLMMQASKKETEALICRIAQMARAVGMHLIIATQRPSVDVITGVIKANIPTRIAFTVTSGVDSRTIIDTIGAEDLLGMGDMLYLPGNMSRPIRVQGVYVSTKEIERVTNRIKLTVEPAYDESITQVTDTGGADIGMVGAGGDGTDQDSLYSDALELIRDTGKASASLLQRRLSVGYARAARILDILEEHGVIGPANGAKPRDIYINKD